MTRTTLVPLRLEHLLLITVIIFSSSIGPGYTVVTSLDQVTEAAQLSGGGEFEFVRLGVGGGATYVSSTTYR